MRLLNGKLFQKNAKHTSNSRIAKKKLLSLFKYIAFVTNSPYEENALRTTRAELNFKKGRKKEKEKSSVANKMSIRSRWCLNRPNVFWFICLNTLGKWLA